MDSLVGLIKRIGIFMIAAQALIHFAPGQNYAKYMKLVVGIMILLQFISPMNKIMDGIETDFDVQLSEMEKELNGGGLGGGYSEPVLMTDKLLGNLEKEIKTKLNNELDGEKYSVMKVSVRVSESGKDESGNGEMYNIESIKIIVRAYEDYTKQDKISIDKITVDAEALDETASDETNGEGVDEACESLRKRFSDVLGIEETYVEVSVYGTV